MIRTVIYGYRGKMGQALEAKLSEQEGFQLVAGIDRAVEGDPLLSQGVPVFENPMEYTGEVDVIIDFSHPSNLSQLIAFAINKKAGVVIATTGHTEGQRKVLKELSKTLPVLHSANMSLGVNFLGKLLKEISGTLGSGFDVEIIEKHHNKKVDAPSGTALYFANQIKKSMGKEREIGIHAVRGGTIVGEHTVIFAGMDEVLEFKHSAQSKGIFAIGAIRAAKYLYGKSHGFYTMEDVF